MALRRFGVRGAAILFVFSLPAAEAQVRPCDCSDVARVEDVINQVERLEKAFRESLMEMYGPNAAPNPEQLYLRSYQRAGFKNPKKSGGLTSTGEPYVSPEVEKAECDSIVRAIKLHEMYHRNHYMKKVLFPALFAFTDKARARLNASSEVGAYGIEGEYLKQVLAQLKNGCTWKCRCNGQMYKSAAACAAGCPPAKLGVCVAPTCLEIDPKTGKWTMKGY